MRFVSVSCRGIDPMGSVLKLRILIVEDELLIAIDLEDLLTSFGHDVCGIATTAAQAEEMAGNLHPDLVLTDINLARGSSGIDAARAILSRFRIPSVFLSSQNDAKTREQVGGLSLGCLQKPCAPAKLRSTLNHAARVVARAA